MHTIAVHSMSRWAIWWVYCRQKWTFYLTMTWLSLSNETMMSSLWCTPAMQDSYSTLHAAPELEPAVSTCQWQVKLFSEVYWTICKLQRLMASLVFAFLTHQDDCMFEAATFLCFSHRHAASPISLLGCQFQCIREHGLAHLSNETTVKVLN